MDTKCEYISYESTGLFTPITIDYINNSDKLKPFYSHEVSFDGLKNAIAHKKKHHVDRKLLIETLINQYEGYTFSSKQHSNLQSLANENTFTITTAHQPVIFTGPLYVIYKIIHAIRLADECNNQFPEYKFVPVFYMGSEDADLDELGHIHINGRKITWNTNQQGAVGRMIVDDALIGLINSIHGELSVNTFGKEISELMKQSYKKGVSIQQATLSFLHALFKDYGLLVLIPDNAQFKKQFIPVIQNELQSGFSHQIVSDTIKHLSVHYKQQATGRQINLFYLHNNIRERIEKIDGRFVVKGIDSRWSLDEMLAEAEQHPERFSPNVILRPLYQETILPNVVFIGGGGENAYWLELKNLFLQSGIPYPMIVLRNSFLIIQQKQIELLHKLNLSVKDLFTGHQTLTNNLVTVKSNNRLNLNKEKENIVNTYASISDIVSSVDQTLIKHTNALAHQALEKLNKLEKKMLRAEKRKYAADVRHLDTLFNELFPKNGLQERVENILPFIAGYGKEFLKIIYDCSKGFEQEFGIVELKNY